MRFTFLAALSLALPALGQNAEIQKELIQRQQAQDAFAQQLRQQQELVRIAPGDARRAQEFESRFLAERHRLENVSAAQLRDVKPETPEALRPQERQRADDDRKPYVLPAGGIVQVPPPRDCSKPRPLTPEREPLPIDSRKPAGPC